MRSYIKYIAIISFSLLFVYSAESTEQGDLYFPPSIKSIFKKVCPNCSLKKRSSVADLKQEFLSSTFCLVFDVKCDTPLPSSWAMTVVQSFSNKSRQSDWKLVSTKYVGMIVEESKVTLLDPTMHGAVAVFQNGNMLLVTHFIYTSAQNETAQGCLSFTAVLIDPAKPPNISTNKSSDT